MLGDWSAASVHAALVVQINGVIVRKLARQGGAGQLK